MQGLSENDRTFIVETVRRVLAAKAPEEVDIYAVSSDDILRHAAARATPEADSDAYFGGLEQTLGEILTHAMALIAVEFLRHGWTLSRARTGPATSRSCFLRTTSWSDWARCSPR